MSVRCRDVESRLRALLDEELEPAESRRLLLHLDRCPRCSAAYERLQAVVGAVRELEPDPVPAHFEPNLQLRLRGLRVERARRRQRFAAWLSLGRMPLRWRITGALGTVAAVALAAVVLLPRTASAQEIARRAERYWASVRNYGCVFRSRGVYQGQQRSFFQTQFYRRPGDYRLDTRQDYPLTTFVYRDRIVHFVPRGDWKGVGPIVIVRPRFEGQDAVPFPFGVTWHGGGNISLEGLIRQLARNERAEVLGTEKVGDRECYRIAFLGTPVGGFAGDQYELWIDCESYLPRRVSWFRDPQNHIVTEAQDLQVNYDVLPPGTFDFQIPEGACVIEGDIDPHLIALPLDRSRIAEFRREPVIAAGNEIWRRSSAVPFPVQSPEWLPDGFELIRVRRKVGKWVDAHWIRPATGGRQQVVKLVQQDGAVEPPPGLAAGEGVRIPGEETAVGRLVRRDEPYPHHYLTWRRGGTRLLLFAAGLDRGSVLRIAGSIRPAQPREAPAPSIASTSIPSAEPSVLPHFLGPMPQDGQPASSADAVLDSVRDPMMPEMSDEDTR